MASFRKCRAANGQAAGSLWAMGLYVKRSKNNSEVQCRW
jgi:hypothetical protein